MDEFDLTAEDIDEAMLLLSESKIEPSRVLSSYSDCDSLVLDE